MVGHRTESIYRRYAIADEAMLKEGALKLAALHGSDRVPSSASITNFPTGMPDACGKLDFGRGHFQLMVTPRWLSADN